MSSYNETSWDRYFENQKYTLCEEVSNVVRLMTDPAYVEQFCEIICEAYLADCERAIKFFNKNKLDESNAYAFLDDYESLADYLQRRIDAEQEREF